MSDQSPVTPASHAVPATLILALGGALGLAADLLLRAGPGGPGSALWMGLLGGAATYLAARGDGGWTAPVAGWSAVATAAAAAMVLRDTDVAHVVLVVTILTCAAMVVLRTAGARLWHISAVQQVVGLAMVPLRAGFGAIPVLARVELPETAERRRAWALARGALLALPLLALFAALFASADAGFERQVQRLGVFVSEDVVLHLALIVGFGWIAAGLLSALRPHRLPEPPGTVRLPRLGKEETGVVLGLLSLLFVAFVALQLGYLFGGRATIEATSGLTVADYARRGFFELMWVAVFTVGLLVVADGVSVARRLFRVLGGVLVACVLVMLLSAAQRLALYTDAFGLTVDRVFAAAVMAWLAAVLVILAVTLLRERPGRFASGAVVAGMATAFVLVALNPAALVARVNLDRTPAGDPHTDARYLARLSADAVPVLVARIGELSPEGQCVTARSLLDRWGPASTREHGLDDWRSWNAARAAARHAVGTAAARLRAMADACSVQPAPTQTPSPGPDPDGGVGDDGGLQGRT